MNHKSRNSAPKSFWQKAYCFAASKHFFYLIVGLLVIQAGWIALSGRYPMAFDEEFHLGLIKIYSEHISPFWSSYLPGSGEFGAIARDPSYLFHYVFGQFYQLLSAITDSLYVQVLVLRFINIALFASGLIIFKRLLDKTKASKALINYVLLVFVLIPVVPLLAAQINYDNLLLPVVGLMLILTLKINTYLTNQKIKIMPMLVFIALLLFGSLVKYAFLPFALAASIFLVLNNRKRFDFKRYKTDLTAGLKTVNKTALTGMVLLIVVLGGLFFERYGLNLINYHKPVADCGEVLSYNECKAYGPWIRDYKLEQNKSLDANTTPINYMPEWLYGMWYRSFFAVDGLSTGYQTRGPLLMPAVISITLLIISPILVALSWRKIIMRYPKDVIYLYATVIGVYILVLWLDQFDLFVKTGKAVAVNGRYLIPILPLLFIITGLSFSEIIKNRTSKFVLAGIILICLIWGGGALTYVLRSNNSWYWHNNFMSHANWTLQRSIGPFTPGYHKGNLFRR